MLKRVITVVFCGIFYTVTATPAVHTVDAETALAIARKVTQQTLIFVNIDEPSLYDIYIKDYNPILKAVHKLCRDKKREGQEALACINTVMKTIYPLYPLLHKHAPHVIGVTRRSLRWSHFVRSSSYEQGVNEEARRYIFAIEKEDPQFEEDYEYIESNTGVLYIDKAHIGKAISSYVTDWNNNCLDKDQQNTCYGIVYIDRYKENVEICVKLLSELFPTIKTIGLHVA